MHQLNALLGHCEKNECDGDREQQSFEVQYGQPDILANLTTLHPRQRRRQRRTEQEERAFRKQHENGRPPRDQRFAAAAPELVGGPPCIAREDDTGDQHPCFHGVCDRRDEADPEPADGTRKYAYKTRGPPAEDAGASPGCCECGQQDGVREVNRHPGRDSPIQAKQRCRCSTQQMRRAPPRHCRERRILHPHKQQQKAEHGLDINRHEKQRVYVEIHLVRHPLRPAQQW